MAEHHMMESPETILYASVVSREIVRIALMIAILNDLWVKLGDMLSAYIQVPVIEKVWTTLGPEFCKDDGKTEVIVTYGLTSAGIAFNGHLARCIESMWYESFKSDLIYS